jgi:archaellum component FlaG (FlaF/FlaG flagellin family)
MNYESRLTVKTVSSQEFIMSRPVGSFGVVVVAILASFVPANAQEWAQKMFKDTEHNFGTVIRDSKTEYSFVLENLYMEDVHIAAVRTSCGCTTPRIETPTLKTYEKGSIVAHFNTDTFSGQRGATVTVTIDKPYYAEVQLHVKGFIRTDVMLNPGSVQFGAVDQGAAFLQKVNVNYNGGYSNWKIVDVKTDNPHLKVDVAETNRNYGQANYSLNVRLDDKAPVGYLNDHVMLITSDNQKIPVLVEGRIEPAVSVSPAALFMGVVQPGQKVTKQLVVKSKKPFKILSITCDDKSFEFNTAKEDAAKPVHLIPVTFNAGGDLGKVVKTIKIQTDQGQFTPELAAYAVVSK